MPARLLEYLAVSGARDTTGAAVSTGTVNFYQPGTMTPVAVYSDDAASLTITQPITLDAGGRTTCYAIAPVRAIVKDVNGVTVLDLTRVDGDRAELVWQTATGWTASSVKTALEALATSLGGTDGKLRPTGGSVDQYLKDWAGNFWINVKSRGAVGDGVADDTSAIQGAIDDLSGLTPPGGVVYFPPGIYLTGEIAIGQTGGTSADYAITLKGAGARASTLKLSSGSSHAVIAQDADNLVIEDLGFGHGSTTIGAAVRLEGCQYAHVNRIYVPVGKYAVGVEIRDSLSSARPMRDVCVSNSTLNNVSDAANAAIRIGRSASVSGNEAITVRDCSLGRSDTSGDGLQVEGLVSGILITGNRIQRRLYVAAASGAHTAFTGFGVAVIGNQIRTEIDVHATGARGFQEYGNCFSVDPTVTDLSDGAVWGSAQLARRPIGNTGTQPTTAFAGAFVPDLATGNVFLVDSSGEQIKNPINATHKIRGMTFTLILQQTLVDAHWSFDTEYAASGPHVGKDGITDSSVPIGISQDISDEVVGTTTIVDCVWDGTKWRLKIGTTTDT